jgi:site-specific recombinase XerD
MTGDRRDRDPTKIPVRDAVERYLRRRRSDATAASVKSYKYRLKLFVEWCEGVGADRVGDLSGYDLDEYYELRSAKTAPSTLHNEMSTVRKFAEFLESLEAVDDGLADRVRVPTVDKEDNVDETRLKTEDAIPLLQYYRNDPGAFGTRAHALLELAWMTGARQGGLRALDIRDVYLEDNFIEFRHRPDTGPPLKNKIDGERPVAIPAETSDALDRFIQQHRHDVHDDHGRQPLLASARGRPGEGTVRDWTYLATQPCLHSPCPHGKERDTCEWTKYKRATNCPSSRSPHQVRTGSITWQLNIGIPPAVVADRVNATVDTIRQHYDQATTENRLRRRRERMERDRRGFINEIELTESDHEKHD